jgi:Na+/H+-dicarboxylate symporter
MSRFYPRNSRVRFVVLRLPIDLNQASLLLIMGVDHFLDMGRTATNVLGNSIASAVVTKWEGQLGPEMSEETFEAATRANEALREEEREKISA